MKIHALMSKIHTKYVRLPDHQKPIALLIAALLGIAVLILLLNCCLLIASSKKPPPAAPVMIRKGEMIIVPETSPLRLKMSIKTVSMSKDPHVVSFPGMIESNPSFTVNILPPLAGRLISIKVKLGDVVQPNQLLAVIRSPGLAQAYSDRNKALSMLKLTQEALKRAKYVNRAGANAIKDIELAQSNYIQALSEFDRAKATIKTLGKNSFSLLNIKTPIKGRVTAVKYGIGSYINDPTTPLMTITNIDSIWATANIPENFIGVVAKGQPAEIFLPAYPKEILHGTVSFVNSFLEADTRRNKTRIALPNPGGKLQPNMFTTVKIALPQPLQILIPLSAILMSDDNTSVFVETTPWTFVRRLVELGTEDNNNVRVLSGLKAGERFVVAGGVLMND